MLAAHQLLTDAFRTDVRPLLTQVREEMGTPLDPIAAYRASGYEEKIRDAARPGRRQRRFSVVRLLHRAGTEQPARSAAWRGPVPPAKSRETQTRAELWTAPVDLCQIQR